MGAVPAKPLYAVGETVRYVDRQGRIYDGVVRRIEANWHFSEIPLVVYSVWHPTYRNNVFYTTVENIYGRAALAGKDKQ